ncbi:hypothetical protein GCM10008933_38500 [Paenibacillus motobuensis]|uniref:Uncharacterized protein n=1 Tax=Paenibacillus motobuensis TaxID=295324 RepID=A0ABN0YQ00_9BACL
MGTGNNSFNHMKSKGRTHNFVIQPLLSSGASTILIIGFQYLFMRLDYGSIFANELFVKGIKSGWHVILSVFIGMYIVYAITNVIRWEFHKRKSK